jgi:hypothetical protein
MSEENSATAVGNNTGVLPPAGEESANFENVSNNSANSSNNSSNSAETPNGVPGENAVVPGENAAVNAAVPGENAGVPGENAVAPLGAENSPVNTGVGTENAALGANSANAVEVPATALTAEPTGKPKRAQSAKQQATIAAQAAERASLKEAGVKKPTVAMVATLASMKARGDPNYNTAFANATAGRNLSSYRTAKKPRKATVTNTTVARNNSAAPRNNSAAPRKTAKKSKTKNTGFSSQTNLLGSNLPNTGAMNAKVDSIMSIAGAISTQVKELMHLARTLKSKRVVPRNNTARVRKPRSKKTATVNALGFGNLPTIPEENQQLRENNDNEYFNQLR